MPNLAKTLFSYPTTTLIVDDDPGFLETLTHELTEKGLRCLPFSSPLQALEYLTLNPNSNWFESCLNAVEQDSPRVNTLHQLSIDLPDLLLEASAAAQTNEISTVIIDYHMPALAGDQFASSILDRRIQKLMLTGQMDAQKAIRLLNDRLIDQYTEKTISACTDAVYHQVINLQVRYFELLSHQAGHLFFTEEGIFSDLAYTRLLTDLIDQYQISEQYLISKKGSRVLIDSRGQQYWFIIADEDDYAGWIETAILAEANQKVIDQLRQREALLFLFTEDENRLAPNAWLPHLHETQYFTTLATQHYYSVIKAQKIVFGI